MEASPGAALLGLIALALVFDFLNGLHDAANSIATIVSTRVMPPRLAVFWAAFFNFIAFAVFGLHVAQTIGTGIIAPGIVDLHLIFGALTGAIAWNVITWLAAIPSSSSHALIGGLLGAGVAKAGISAVVWKGTLLTIGAKYTPRAVQHLFRRAQFGSAALYSLGHGGNDAQKTMGIIAVLLYSQRALGSSFYVPVWVILTCNAAMALGTLAGGWRIVKTMGGRITGLNPMQGSCAETGGALTLFLATFLGIPVSTTHTISGAIAGVGAARRVSAVRWNVAGSIVIAWVLTLPASGIIAAIAYFLAPLG